MRPAPRAPLPVHNLCDSRTLSAAHNLSDSRTLSANPLPRGEVVHITEVALISTLRETPETRESLM